MPNREEKIASYKTLIDLHFREIPEETIRAAKVGGHCRG